MFLLSSAWAATVPGSHSNVIAACQDSSVDTIEVLSGAELGNGVCQVKRPLLIKSPSGQRIPPVSVSPGGDLVLEGVEIQVTGSDPAVQAVEAPVELNDVHLFYAGGSGDAVYGWDTSVVLNEVLIEGFSLSTPVRLFAFQAPLSLEITDSELSSNTFKIAYISGNYGFPVTVDVTGSEFSNNASSDYYGPFEVQGDVALTVSESLFVSNVGDVGGALHVGEGASVVVEGGAFVDNISRNDGGAIYVYGSSVALDGVVFDGNTAATYGGALTADASAPLIVANSEFYGNTAKKGGALDTSGTLEVVGSIFCQNEASTDNGSAVYSTGSAATYQVTSFQDHPGRAVAGSSMSSTSFTHVTFVDNEIAFAPGGGELVVQDSLLWQNDQHFETGWTFATWLYDAWDTRPAIVPDAADQLEITDPGFVEEFEQARADGDCAIPFLTRDSVLLEKASDGLHIGAFGPDEHGGDDSGVTFGDSGDDSGIGPDSDPSDSSPDDSGRLDSATPDPDPPVTWVAGGCRGPASAFLLAGILLLSRTFRARAD